MKIHIVLAAALALTCVRPASAQTSLTLDQAIEMALTSNPTVIAAARDAEAAGIGARGARALANPSIIVAPSVAGQAGSDEEVLFVQPLEINGSRRARAGIAAGEAQAANATEEVARLNLIREVKLAYWDTAKAQAIVELNHENVKFQEAMLSAATRQVEVGSAPGSHAIKAGVELARAKQELARSEAELGTARATLNVLIGREAQADTTASDSLQYEPYTIAFDELEVRALDNRPEIERAGALLSARDAEVDAARTQARPDLAIQARKESFGGDGGIGIGLTLPILDWGARRARKSQAETAFEAEKLRVKSEKNRVRLEVERAVISLKSAEERVKDFETGVLTSSEQLAQMAEKGYRAGATSYLEVLEAQRTLRDVKSEYIAALADYAKAKAEIQWAVGSTAADEEGSK